MRILWNLKFNSSTHILVGSRLSAVSIQLFGPITMSNGQSHSNHIFLIRSALNVYKQRNWKHSKTYKIIWFRIENKIEAKFQQLDKQDQFGWSRGFQWKLSTVLSACIKNISFHSFNCESSWREGKKNETCKFWFVCRWFYFVLVMGSQF